MKRLLVLLLLLAPSSLAAQAPHEDWRTVTTDSFRVHYPAPWEEWALRAASRLESARERVAAAVGYNPGEHIEVVIMDPAAAANGMALPLLDRPSIILWTTPPGPLSAVGDARDWQELLLVHETAHILHLNRPSRDPLDRFLERFIPIGPVASAPRWVSEGYATVIEGDLTGSGRPFRDFRAAVLRTWATEGRLPSYSQLASDSRSFMGMSMAYLAGSAYLEWLRERTSPDSLVHLWRRMSARQDRSFDEAFAGVFGDSPQDLYALFRAELIQKSRNLSEEMASGIRNGELVLDLARSTVPLDVSADGAHLVTVSRPHEQPVSIVIRETAPDQDALAKREEKLIEMIERDPEDVRPVDPPAAARRKVHDLTLPGGANVESLAFTGSGLQLAFTSSHPDDDGVMHSELHVWNPGTGTVDRITERGDVFSISSAGAGEIVAVRHRYGKSGLVRIDLENGAETVLRDARLEPLVIDVAASPGRLAWVERDGARWNVVLASREGQPIRTIPAPEGAMIADIVWRDDDLYASLGLGGFIELARLDVESGTWSDLTRTTGAVFSPAPAGDWIYFLALDPEGLDVRRIHPSASTSIPTERIRDARYAPAVRVPFDRPAPAPLEARAISEPHPYGFGPRSTGPFFSGYSTSHHDLVEAGIRSSDPIGRLDAILAGGWSEDGERGAILDVLWHGSPSALGATAWGWRPADDAAERWGAAAHISDQWLARSRAISLSLTAGWEHFDGDGAFADRDGLAARLSSRGGIRRQLGSADASFGYEIDGSRSEAENTTRGRSALWIAYSSGSFGVDYRDAIGESDEPGAFRLGGLVSSILPPFEQVAMVEIPAIAAGRLVSDDFRDQRASLRLPVIPGELFAQRITASVAGANEEIELAGWTLQFEMERMPIIGLPALELELGAAWEFDAPSDEDVTWWLGTRWALD